MSASRLTCQCSSRVRFCRLSFENPCRPFVPNVGRYVSLCHFSVSISKCLLVGTPHLSALLVVSARVLSIALLVTASEPVPSVSCVYPCLPVSSFVSPMSFSVSSPVSVPNTATSRPRRGSVGFPGPLSAARIATTDEFGKPRVEFDGPAEWRLEQFRQL